MHEVGKRYKSDQHVDYEHAATRSSSSIIIIIIIIIIQNLSHVNVDHNAFMTLKRLLNVFYPLYFGKTPSNHKSTQKTQVIRQTRSPHEISASLHFSYSNVTTICGNYYDLATYAAHHQLTYYADRV